MIDASFLRQIGREGLVLVLAEYRHLVHRFPQWVASTIAHSEDNQIRRLLISNLCEEIGEGVPRGPSHFEMLEKCCRDCGVAAVEVYRPFESTIQVERHFTDTFAREECIATLAMLGPGTEAVSNEFLLPLESAVRRECAGKVVDLSYFDAHRGPIEEQHARNIQTAIGILEATTLDARTSEIVADWASRAIQKHSEFWSALAERLVSISR